jgi:hypothetical protein
MKEMLVLMASLMSAEQIVERMQSALDEYKEAQLLNNKEKIEDAKKGLLVSCHLCILHHVTEKDGGPMEVIERMKEFEMRSNLFKDVKN